MAKNLSGTPGAQVSITDLSIILANQLKGIGCVQLVTKRGVPGKEYLVGNWEIFKRKLGGLIEGIDDPQIAKMALDAGAVLRVTRAFHYTDVDDLDTVDGTKASGAIAGTVAETLAKGGFDVIAGSANPGTNRITSITVNGVEILGANIDWTTSNENTASLVAAQIDTFNSNPEYTAQANGNTVEISADAGSGSTPNGFQVVITTEGDVETGNVVHMAGGIAAGPITANFEAEAVGDGYNGTVVKVAAAASNIANFVDISVTLPDSDIEVVVTGIDRTKVTQVDIDKINSKLRGKEAGIQVASITGAIAIGQITLANGVQTVSSIVDADYNGSAISKSGFHAFDNVTDSSRIFNVNRASAVVDIYLATYATNRGDMRACLRTPLGLTAAGVEAYRDGTTPYSHQPVDTLFANYWYTDAEINDPQDSDITDKKITALGAYIGRRLSHDRNLGEWFAAAGDFGGKLTGINRMNINFLAQGNKAYYDVIYEKGVNAIVEHPTFKICAWGNRSCLLNKTKLTSKDNIADMVVFIARVVKGIAEGMSFRPNDFIMFNLLYRSVRPFIVDTLVKQRAIQGDASATNGEGKWWHWFGDQFAQTPEDLTFNTQSDIDAGKYRVRFAFKPIAANEYIAIDIAPADSATILNVQQLTNI